MASKVHSLPSRAAIPAVVLILIVWSVQLDRILAEKTKSAAVGNKKHHYLSFVGILCTLFLLYIAYTGNTANIHVCQNMQYVIEVHWLYQYIYIQYSPQYHARVTNVPGNVYIILMFYWLCIYKELHKQWKKEIIRRK